MEPTWLPCLIDTNGDWDETLQRLYQAFCQDFKNGTLWLDGIRVNWDREILPGEKFEEAFWKLITGEDCTIQQRVPEFERAKLLSWCAAILRNADDPCIIRWVYREKGRLRSYLWLRELDYVIVLKPVPPDEPRYYFFGDGIPSQP